VAIEACLSSREDRVVSVKQSGEIRVILEGSITRSSAIAE